MKNNGKKLSTEELNGILAEYNSLRSEILQRIEIRNSVVFGTLTFAGVLLGFGVNTPTLDLMYIVISMFLASTWVQSDIIISELRTYIQKNIEGRYTGICWETLRIKNREIEIRGRPTIVFASSGVFLVTQFVALLIAFSNVKVFSLLEWILSGCAVVCMLMTGNYFRISKKYS